uniref:Uncharacterized protein n=1 Tax=Anguilla anguilla TaxID=7936 RepID=A0A0E9VGU5_ANGAN
MKMVIETSVAFS